VSAERAVPPDAARGPLHAGGCDGCRARPFLLALAAGGKVFVLAAGVTLVESTNAKLWLFRVPELVAVSLGLGFLAIAIRFL
jgi:formate hydrogenlyase subunit 4